MNIVVIIQARLGSTRLPGKVLEPIGSTTVLAEVIRRSRAISGVDMVCCAVPDTAAEDVLATAAQDLDVMVCRGHATDVLSRYVMAARATHADIVLRITGDKPLIDPEICGNLLKLFLDTGADFSSNNTPPGWPHGLDCEIFSAAALYGADFQATDPEDREHVTPWIRRNKMLRHANLEGPGGSVTDLRWTLDYPEDLEFLQALFDELPPPPAMPTYDNVMAILARHPELSTINAKWQHLSRFAEPETLDQQ